MSSIIKGERIRNQSIINLSERFQALHIEYEKNEIEDEALVTASQLNTEIEDNLVEMSHLQKEEILLEAKKEADLILKEAHQKAEEILAQALQKAEEIKGEAQSQQTQLLAQIEEKTSAILEDAEKEAESIKLQATEEKRMLIDSTESEMVEVLQQLLTYLVGEEVYNNTQWLTCIVKRMLEECHTKEIIKICIAPTLFEHLTESQKNELQALGENIILEERSTLNETTCVVETTQGSISYDVKEGLERVISQIKTLEKLS